LLYVSYKKYFKKSSIKQQFFTDLPPILHAQNTKQPISQLFRMKSEIGLHPATAKNHTADPEICHLYSKKPHCFPGLPRCNR